MIPVTIFSGFLGAGKTTLISNLLHQCRGSRIAVLVNEFGKVSIDGQVLSRLTGRKVEVIALSAPLIAYAGDEEFAVILQDLLARPAKPDYVIIETSGLAVPTAIMERLAAEFKSHFVVDATLNVVDTPLLLSGASFAAPGAEDAVESSAIQASTGKNEAAADVFARQLMVADVVVLNKIDDLSDEDLVAAEAIVRRFAPGVRFVELSRAGVLDPRVALGLRLNQPVAVSHAQELVVHGHADGHEHSGMQPHEHGLDTHTHIHEHDPGWLSFALTCSAPITAGALLQSMTSLVAAEPVVRLKGTVHDENGTHLSVHGVRDQIVVAPESDADGESHHHHHHEPDHHHHGHSHDHHDHNDDHEHHDHHHHESDHEHPQHHHEGAGQVVFIGYHLSRERVVRHLSESSGVIWE